MAVAHAPTQPAQHHASPAPGAGHPEATEAEDTGVVMNPNPEIVAEAIRAVEAFGVRPGQPRPAQKLLVKWTRFGEMTPDDLVAVHQYFDGVEDGRLVSSTPEQIADDMLKNLSSTDPSAVYPYVVGWIGSIVENDDRSAAECRERIRASLAAAEIVRQRLIERRRDGA